MEGSQTPRQCRQPDDPRAEERRNGRRLSDGRPGSESRLRVVVVGAGVSGCACAATLAASGIPVTVMNSALDSVGQPGYGPVVTAGSGGWDRIVDTMAGLPPVLSSVWLDASSAVGHGSPVFFVDRRMLSIETKRALERVPGLEFRQGLVTDLKIRPDETVSAETPGRHGSRMMVGTALGETVEADAVVLAVGLSLGGRVRVGDDILPGGRYGETPSDGLREALETLGAAFSERRLEVGSRFTTRDLQEWGADHKSLDGSICAEGCGRRWVVTTVPLRDALGALDGHRRENPERRESAWPLEYPPAPHWTEELRPRTAVLTNDAEGAKIPWLSPDGAATGEMHLWPEGAGSRAGETIDQTVRADDGPGGEGAIASRLCHTVTGLVITNVSPTGRVGLRIDPAPFVWTAGRTGGAADYLESLASGVRVADDVAKVLTTAAASHTSGRRSTR